MKKSIRKRDKFHMILIYLFIITCMITGMSMAKYQSIYTSSGVAAIAKWSITVNDQDLTGEGTTLNNIITLVPEENSNVASGKIAPGFGGYFDITIDPSETEVSLEYTIKFDTTNLPTDVIIVGYGDKNSTSSTTEIVDNQITGEINIQDGNPFTSADAITYRVFWNWEDVRSNDSAHTLSATSGTEYKVGVEVTVNQKIV